MNPNTESMERMKQFIAEHLQESITASGIAKSAGYSQHHSARIFKEEAGLREKDIISISSVQP